jgi:hypothetical protein
MAEKHKIYSAGSGYWRDFLWSVYDFVANQQTGIVRFVNNGGTDAINSGSGFITPTAATDFGAGSYIVIEPVTASQGGTRWQVKFLAETNAASGNVNYGKVQMSFSGGWDNAMETFNVSTAVTDAELIASWSITAADSFYLSCSNSDTFTNGAGSQSYSYFRALIWDQDAAENSKLMGSYAGGYIPVDSDSNTKPAVLMCRYAQVLDAGASWGDRTTTEDYCLLPGDYEHSGAAGVNAGFAGTGDTTGAIYFSSSPDGSWANAPMILSDNTANRTVGAFGKFSMFHGHSDRADGATDANLEYMVSQAIMLRWKPSA